MTNPHTEKSRKRRANPEKHALELAARRKWRRDNPEAYAAQVERDRQARKERREASPEYHAAQNKAAKEYYWANRETEIAKSKAAALLREYGITQEEYDQKFEAQKGLCAICRQPSTIIDKRRGVVRKLAVDHDHTTGAVRDLLCQFCNNGLGHFRDSIGLLQAAIDYLLVHLKE
jgi:hypothetical protein